MLAVMYHYVRDNNPEYPNFKNLTVDQFKRQIDFFYDTYGFLSKEDFISSIEQATPPPTGVILTFDDGFKDHYHNVLPILEEKKAWGLFYVPTAHYKNKKVLNEARIGEFDKEIYKDQQLTSCELQFKRLFNYYVRNEYKTKILDEIALEYLNEVELYDKLYLTKEELKEMERCGSVIGSHTETHPVLSTLNYEQQKEEVEESYNFLNLFLDMRWKSFCYPYGGKSTYNQDTFKVLTECGVHHAFAVGNKPLRTIANKYELTRVDCNRFN